MREARVSFARAEAGFGGIGKTIITAIRFRASAQTTTVILTRISTATAVIQIVTG